MSRDSSMEELLGLGLKKKAKKEFAEFTGFERLFAELSSLKNWRKE